MLVTTLASTIAAILFLAAMLYATISDLRRKRIPNWLIIVLAVAYLPLALAAGYAPVDMVVNMGVAVLVFAGGLACFSKGWLGGGDVKLAAVSTLWLGAGLTLPYLLLTALFGGAFTLAALIGLRVMARKGRDESSLRDGGLPYGPGMACAALLLFQISPWANALSA
jgi:prepilin peptidase CpaA